MAFHQVRFSFPSTEDFIKQKGVQHFGVIYLTRQLETIVALLVALRYVVMQPLARVFYLALCWYWIFVHLEILNKIFHNVPLSDVAPPYSIKHFFTTPWISMKQ